MNKIRNVLKLIFFISFLLLFFSVVIWDDVSFIFLGISVVLMGIAILILINKKE